MNPKPFGVTSGHSLVYCARFGRLLRGKWGQPQITRLRLRTTAGRQRMARLDLGQRL